MELKRHQKYNFLILWIYAYSIFCGVGVLAAEEDYSQNPYVEDAVWNALKPHFLPLTMPIKNELDAIFKKDVRLTASKHSLIQAGFKFTEVQGICASVFKHPNMPGYVFKILLDDQDTRQDWKSWLNRIEGAKSVRNAIKKLGFEHLFTVPEKWVYPLPAEPSPAVILNGGRKNFILIAKNVHPLPRNENLYKWKKLNDKKVLDALYAVLMKTGAADSTKENNIPWCRSGKIAFVDLEHHHDWKKIRFYRLERVLNKKMRSHWRKLYLP